MIQKSFQAVKTVGSSVISGMSSHGLMTYAACIGFYTIFSLPGLLITIILVAGIFLGQDAASGQLAGQLSEFVGSSSAETIEGIIAQSALSGGFSIKTAIGIGTLLFSATTIFMSLQEALNKIWDVVATPKRGFVKYLLNRVLSLGMIIGLGFILIVSMVLDTILEVFFDQVQNWIGKEPSILLEVTSTVVSFGVIFVVIMLIFKFLPDVKLRWKDVAFAGLITAALFVLGKVGIAYYLETSSFSETYQAAGSIIILLLWIYYSTVILLFGAEITRAIMIYRGTPIRPAEGAKKVAIQQLDYKDYRSRLDEKATAKRDRLQIELEKEEARLALQAEKECEGKDECDIIAEAEEQKAKENEEKLKE